jgi:thiol-disulfide isomerase/thioredoxin
MAALGGAVLVSALAGCKPEPEAEANASPPPASQTATVASCGGTHTEGGSLHWYRDAYTEALRCAADKGVPLVIDMWAPWCHTCLSMQSTVLIDERLADYDRRMVFLALDTDREVNAAAVAAFPPAAWPTFFVVSPIDESIQSRFVGAATVEQFAGFLDDGERGHQALRGGELPSHDAAAREGDRASARKDWDAARKAYEDALADAPREWPRRPDVLVSLIATRARAKDWSTCVEIATQRMDETGASASTTDFGSHALGCAAQHPDPATQARVRERVVARLSALVDDETAQMSVDDRADALVYLRQANDELGRKDLARVAAERERRLLDEAAGAAASPREAMTFNWPRAEVYAYLGVPLELVPALERSAADLPKEYDPPYRLAWIHLQAKQLDDARTWAERAVQLAYGPRKARAQGMLADIHRARGDATAERDARAAIVATLEGLPKDAQNPDAIAKAKADLAALGQAQ